MTVPRNDCEVTSRLSSLLINRRHNVLRTSTTLCLSLLFVWGLGLSESATAADSTAKVVIDDVRIGFDGYYKVGEWTPIFVTVTPSTDLRAQMVVAAPDVDSDWTYRSTEQVKLTAGKPFRWESRFKTGRAAGELKIEIRSEERILVTETLRAGEDVHRFREGLSPSDTLWIAIGEPAGFNSQDAETAVGQEQTEVRAEIAAEDLPSQWRSYSAVDALIIATAAPHQDQPSFFEHLTAPQSEAMSQWVRNGGMLALSIGQEVEAYLNSPLASWLPLKITGQADRRQLGDVEAIASQREPLPRFRSVKAAVISDSEEDFDGKVFGRSRNGPTLVRVPYGFGRIALIAIDINQTPIKEWGAAEALLQRFIVEAGQGVQRSGRNTSQKISRLGITDLSSQLSAIQQDIQSAPRISVWTILGLVILYMFLIGPLDYWLVHKVLKRPELTWITFPLFVAAAGGLAIWTSDSMHGQEVQVKQVSFVDLDSRTGQLFTRTWFGVYSPQNEHYTIGAQPMLPKLEGKPDVDISWTAMAENSVGGLKRQGGLQLTNRRYEYAGDGSELEDVPIGHWSAKSFYTDWSSPTEGMIDNQLESPGAGRIRGRFSHAFPVPLTECVLAYGGQAYRLDKMSPYQLWSPTPSQSREIRSFLTGVVAKTSSDERKEPTVGQFYEDRMIYDPLERDLDRVVRMLTFHETAGGKSYTGLAHDVYPEMDYTQHLRLGRAVLLAKAELPVTKITVDGEEAPGTVRETYIRIILPVKKTEYAEGVRILPNTELYVIPDESEEDEEPRRFRDR